MRSTAPRYRGARRRFSCVANVSRPGHRRVRSAAGVISNGALQSGFGLHAHWSLVLNPSTVLLLDATTREKLWKRVFSAVEDYIGGVKSLPVSPDLDIRKIRAFLSSFDFDSAVEPLVLVDQVVAELMKY